MSGGAAPPGTRTLRLDLEYDGSGFVGWQSQSRGRTVQGELARALCTLLREEVVPVGSGRTDAGTHALGQVAHVHTGAGDPVQRLARGLHGLLPPDVAVTSVRDVGPAFHARYSALGKRYRYRLGSGRQPLQRGQVWTHHGPLDANAMAAAAARLVGAHSFRAFCKAHPEPDDFACCVREAGWCHRGPELVFEIEANRFLRHMVRILVGTLVEVGSGRRSAADFADLLEGAARTEAGVTAPARGLCLLWVDYAQQDGGRSGHGIP